MEYDLFAATGKQFLDDFDTALENAEKRRAAFSFLKKADRILTGQALATGRDHEAKKDKKKDQTTRVRETFFKAADNLQTFVHPRHFAPPLPEAVTLPGGSCWITASLALQSPFYSRDDQPFYPVDNPLRRDHVFSWPMLGPSGLKGLIRHAWRMCHGEDGPDEELLFGSARDDGGGRQGLLYPWPLFWEKGRTGQAMINPRDPATGAGTKPISYEIVEPPASATMHLLLANMAGLEEMRCAGLLLRLLRALDRLVLDFGLSAKRSAGWGRVTVSSVTLHGFLDIAADQEEDNSRETDPAETWEPVLDGPDRLKPFDDLCWTRKRLAELSGISEKMVKKKKERVQNNIQDRFRQYLEDRSRNDAPPPARTGVFRIDGSGFGGLADKLETLAREAGHA